MKNRSSSGPKLSVTFGQKPPEAVRWGVYTHDRIAMVMGLTGDGAICRIGFATGPRASSPGALVRDWRKAWKRTAFIRDQKTVAAAAQAIAAGKALRLAMVGTAFQCAVWKNLLAIPAGEVVSYAELARRSQRPKAVRAAGTACGANPVAILVPCHRVIASDGTLGGFGGGLAVKRKLLEKESSC